MMQKPVQNQNSIDTAAMLTELACTPRTGLIVSLPLAATYPCRVVSATGGGLKLEVCAEASLEEFQPLTLVLVSLPSGVYTRAFLSHVREARREEPGKPLTVYLRLPEDLASTPARLAHRTPLLEDHGLEVRITQGKGAGANAQPVDISQGGIGIRFPLDHDPKLARGDQLALELKYGATSVLLGGIVKHADGSGRYGLLFSEAAANVGLVPGLEFQRIVAGLQRHWLQHRSA